MLVRSTLRGIRQNTAALWFHVLCGPIKNLNLELSGIQQRYLSIWVLSQGKYYIKILLQEIQIFHARQSLQSIEKWNRFQCLQYKSERSLFLPKSVPVAVCVLILCVSIDGSVYQILPHSVYWIKSHCGKLLDDILTYFLLSTTISCTTLGIQFPIEMLPIQVCTRFYLDKNLPFSVCAGDRFSVSPQSWCAGPTGRCTQRWPAHLMATKTQRPWYPGHQSRFRPCCPERHFVSCNCLEQDSVSLYRI